MLASARLSRSREAHRGPGPIVRGVPAALFALIGRALAATSRHPGRVLFAVIVGGAAALIAQNALTAQPRRHPAPLFGPARPAAPADKPRPSDRTDAAPMTPARPLVGAPPAVARPTSRDQIGELIRGEATGSTPQGTKPEPQRNLILAQRALSKLGYGPLKADGVMGPGTKQAIQRFEQDRRLPETGELGPRTARELGTRAGMALD